jgi:hypothetical protein
MTIEEAEKAFVEALDKSMGNLCRGDWYKRKTVRMAFRKGWEQAIEEMKVNNCYAPPVSNSLDLRELERKLDEALGKETRETLTEWLKQQRQ